jgi:type IX secretion system PorP/SprF family membrane protein
MKKLIISIVVLLTASSSFSQQDPMLTQYMFNGMFLNPAYAGSHEYWSSTLSYRSQWVGADFEGAPTTAVVSVDGPIRGKNMGLGFTILHDRIGVTNTSVATANYSYQLRLNQNTRLAFGINAGVAQYSSRLTDVLVWDTQDEVYANNLTKVIPRIGVGTYLFSDKYYVGVSIPTVIAYEDGNDFSVDLSKASFLRRHYLLTGGVVLPVSEKVKFKPSLLLKYVKNAPLEGDLTFSAIFNDAFWIGASYRSNDAVGLILEYQTNSFFRVGYAYDITVSGLRGYQNGSHEIMIGVDFGRDLVKVKTPRYF